MALGLLLLFLIPSSIGAWSSGAYVRTCRDHSGRYKRQRPAWTLAPSNARTRMTAFPEDSTFRDGDGQEWPSDGRDSLPFDVYDVKPPRRRKIGVARLPPMTSSGDTMWHGAKHYKILRVICHYKYEGGRFVMRKKSIDAKELKRMAKERVVARLVYGEGNKPPSDI